MDWGIFIAPLDISGTGCIVDRKKTTPRPGGLTREEFEGLREDIQEVLSEHPLSRFTIALIDENGVRTTDPAKAARYGMTVYEGDRVIFEEYGSVQADRPWKPAARTEGTS